MHVQAVKDSGGIVLTDSQYSYKILVTEVSYHDMQRKEI